MWDDDLDVGLENPNPEGFWEETLQVITTPAFLITLYNVSIMLLSIILISMWFRAIL